MHLHRYLYHLISHLRDVAEVEGVMLRDDGALPPQQHNEKNMKSRKRMPTP